MNQFYEFEKLRDRNINKIKNWKKKYIYTDNLLHLAPMKYCILHFE